MHQIDTAVREFGMHLGIKDMNFNENGVCLLRQEDGIVITLELRGSAVLVYASKSIDFLSERTMERALHATCYRSLPGIYAGSCLFNENQIAFFTYIEGTSITFERLRETIHTMHSLLNIVTEQRG